MATPVAIGCAGEPFPLLLLTLQGSRDVKKTGRTTWCLQRIAFGLFLDGWGLMRGMTPPPPRHTYTHNPTHKKNTHNHHHHHHHHQAHHTQEHEYKYTHTTPHRTTPPHTQEEHRRTYYTRNRMARRLVFFSSSLQWTDSGGSGAAGAGAP